MVAFTRKTTPLSRGQNSRIVVNDAAHKVGANTTRKKPIIAGSNTIDRIVNGQS